MTPLLPAFRQLASRAPEWRGFSYWEMGVVCRVKVYVDYQNVYHGARDVFGNRESPPTFGHIHPLRLANLLTQLGRDEDRHLEKATIYRGEPTSRSHPRLQAAFQRQLSTWRTLEPLIEVVTRPLRYDPISWDQAGRPTKWRGQEKGIDVLLALGLVMLATATHSAPPSLGASFGVID